MTSRQFWWGIICASLLALLIPGIALASDPFVDHVQQAIRESGADWEAGETSISSLTLEEFRLLTGVPRELERAYLESLPQEEESLIVAAAPPAIDWRNYGGKDFTTPIRNQGGCGSCVAFSTVAAMEARMEIALNNPLLSPDLSETHLFSCGGARCAVGWWPWLALDFARDTGVVDEACRPYVAADVACSPCAGWQSRVTKLSSWWGTSSVTLAKQALAERGPIEATMSVYQDFGTYRTGVYRHVTGGYVGGHAVTIVGYNDTGGYWIVKNSWGTGWGENGWFRIAYGECDIDDYFWIPEVSVGDTTPPTVSNIMLSSTKIYTAGGPAPTKLTVQANITDPSGVTFARLHYMPPGETTYSYILMTRSDGDRWTGTIGPFDSPGQLTMLIKPRDNAGNLGQSAKFYATIDRAAVPPTPTVAPSPTPASDVQPPTMSNIRASANPIYVAGCSLATTVTIQADVSDPSGVSFVRLHYLAPGTTTWAYIPMSNAMGNSWSGTIGPFTQAGTLTYLLRSRDGAGNIGSTNKYTLTVAPCPVSPTATPTRTPTAAPTATRTPTPAPTATPTPTPADTTPPTVSDITLSANPIYSAGCPAPNTVTVRAKVSDPSGVAFVRLHYLDPAIGEWRYLYMTNTSGTSWEGTIGPFSQPGTVEYLFKPKDNAGNLGVTAKYPLTVQNCGGFVSEFTDGAPNWESHAGQWSVESGRYRTDGIAGKLSSTSYKESFDNFDYQAAFYRTGCDNCANALVVRGSPSPLAAGNYWAKSYLFQYTRNGTFSIWKTENGSFTPLQYWTPCSFINIGSAWNRLRVLVNGTTLQFYINDRLVWSISDASFTAGRVGIGMFRSTSSINDLLQVDWARLTPAARTEKLLLQAVDEEQLALNAMVIVPTDFEAFVGFDPSSSEQVAD